MTVTIRITILFFIFMLPTLTGCSQAPSDQPPLGTVSGVITLDGEPLKYALVLFLPADGRASSAETDSEGRYALNYSEDYPGAQIGAHTVQITTFQEFDHPTDPDRPARPELLPAKYHQKTELTADVQPGTNEINFELVSK